MNYKLITFASLKPAQRKKLDLLLAEASTDPFVGGEYLSNYIEKVKTNSLRKHKDEQFFIIEMNGGYVGFFCPRLDNGYWRSGTIYLAKAHRGKGIMYSVLNEFFKAHTPAMAWISNSNTNSKNLYTKLGFVKGSDYNLSANPIDHGSWYCLEKLVMATESFSNSPKWSHW